MKKLTLYTLIVFTTLLQAQIVNIPDPNFKALLTHPVFEIDTNNDGEIQVTEAQAQTEKIDADYYTLDELSIGLIADLTGIEEFINIKELYCDGNLLNVSST